MASKICFIISIFTLYSPIGLAFPLQLPENCFINFIGTGTQTESIAAFIDTGKSIKQPFTFTVTLQHANKSINENDIIVNVENVTLQELYFRYTLKWRNPCNIFMLQTLTFNETVSAIHNSGYGTSDETLFFVQPPNLLEWNDHIEKFSELDKYSEFIFHANIIFMEPNSSRFGVHCYFCPPNPTRFHPINGISSLSYSQLKLFAQRLNGNGHRRHLVVNSAAGDLDVAECLKIDQDSTQRDRHKFYQHLHKYCAPPDVIIYIVTQHALNGTCVTHEKHVPDEELDDLEWFIHIRFAEGIVNPIPNEIIATRGSILTMQSFNHKALSCVSTRSMSQKLDYVILTVINGSTWLALLLVALAYAFLYKSLSRGLDTMWPLFSQPCWLSHPKNIICIHWICMILLSCIYGSSISSESVQLQDYPSMSTLVKNGYKLWLPRKRYLSMGASKYQKMAVLNLFKNGLGLDSLNSGSYQNEFENVIDFLYDGKNSTSVHIPEFQNLSKLLENLTKFKLFIISPTLTRNLGSAEESKGIINVNAKQICKFFELKQPNLDTKLRLWSYLSYRASHLLKTFSEFGIPVRFEKLKIDLDYKEIRKLNIHIAGACLTPKPIPFMSALGISVVALRFNRQIPQFYFHISTSKSIYRRQRGIQNSEFGTSDETLFSIHLPNWLEWDDHIDKFSALHKYSPFIFHTNIIFISPNSTYMGVHCYFCPPNLTRFYQINGRIWMISPSSYNQLKILAQQLNGNAHGRHVVVTSAVGELSVSECFKMDQHYTQRDRNMFYQHLQKYCAPPEVIIYVVGRQTINATFATQEKDVPDEELDDLEWFINVRYGEGIVTPIPNEIISTRGSILAMQNFKHTVLSCVTTRSISEKLDYVILTVIHGSTWFALLSVALVYAFLYKSLSRGLDTMWPLFSLPCLYNHPKKLIWVQWISMTFVSCIYESNISSDSVQLQDYPTISKLVKNGYKLWVPQKRYISIGASTSQKKAAVALFRNGFGRGPLSDGSYDQEFLNAVDFMYDGSSSNSAHLPDHDNLPKLIDTLWKLKLLPGSPTLERHLGSAAGSNGLINVNDNLVCKFVYLNNVKLDGILRVWSYL
ncbi:unnamed protein product [Orchesella dallaii]|uniref:Uncharacterized protein n=1 Tax=Orchesella dallaii TaxID=48710 RepID=A0ABP1S855_9HEXA